jgi:hypothetical protein
LNWKLEVLWILSLVAIVASLATGDVGGGGLRVILGFGGLGGAMGYLVFKGIASGAPRFAQRKINLIIVLILLSAGVIVASAGGFYDILGQPSTLGIDLETIGTAIFLIAIGGLVVTIARGPSI